jgi:hypothetical protein
VDGREYRPPWSELGYPNEVKPLQSRIEISDGQSHLTGITTEPAILAGLRLVQFNMATSVHVDLGKVLLIVAGSYASVLLLVILWRLRAARKRSPAPGRFLR